MNNMMVDPITGQPLAKATNPVNPMTGMPVQAMPNQAVYGNQAVSNAATNIFGTPEQRQGTVAFMTEAQEKDPAPDQRCPAAQVYHCPPRQPYCLLCLVHL